MSNLSNDIYAPDLDESLTGSSVLFITADDTEDLEFFYPFYRLIEAGYQVDVATIRGGGFKAKHGLGLKNSLQITDVDPMGYDLLYIPGGKAPAQLRENVDAIALVKSFAATARPIAAICHGPQLLARANVIKGRQIAAWPECEADVREAGATFVDKPTVIDGQFITARWPGDLPSQMKAVIQVLSQKLSGETSFATTHIAA